MKQTHASLLLFCVLVQIYGVSSSNLLSAVEKAAGVFQPGYKPKQDMPDLPKTVLMTVANYGYLNHLQNFICFAERLHMQPLIISMETKTHAFITNNTALISHLFDPSPYSSVSINEGHAPYLSKQFVLITNLKIAIQIEVLKLGYHVLFVDTDVPIIRNPMKYLYWKNVDYVHTINSPCDMLQVWDFFWNPYAQDIDGNTGFHFVRSNDRTIRLLEGSFNYSHTTWPGLGDQEVLWRYIRITHDPPQMPIGKCRDIADSDFAILFNSTYNQSNVVSCALDNCLFSAGMINGRDGHGTTRYSYLKNNLRLMKEEMITVHANWMVGNRKKEHALRNTGLWIAKDWQTNFGVNNCLPYEEKEGDPVPPQHTPKNTVNGQTEEARQHSHLQHTMPRKQQQQPKHMPKPKQIPKQAPTKVQQRTAAVRGMPLL